MLREVAVVFLWQFLLFCKTALFWPPVSFYSSWHYLWRWSISPTTSLSSPFSRPILTIHVQVGSLCLQVVYDSRICHRFLAPCPPARPADVKWRSWWLFWPANSPAVFPFFFKTGRPARPMCLTHLEPGLEPHCPPPPPPVLILHGGRGTVSLAGPSDSCTSAAWDTLSPQ